MRPLSYSQISLYRQCPLHYKLQYIDRLPRKEKGYFSFGTSLHACAEHFFGVKVPPPPSIGEMLKFYEENWLSDGYESKEQEQQYFEYGKEILTQFCELHSHDFRMPLATERMFTVDMGKGVKLRGFIDRIDKLDSGGLSIVDYKTNRDLFTADYVENDLQLTLYQVAVEKMFRKPVEKLTLYHLRSNTPCISEGRDAVTLEEAHNLVLEVASCIEKGLFPAIENQYCPCDYPEFCPYFRHQYSDSATLADHALTMPAGEMADRYAVLKGEIDQLQTELDTLKEQIAEYCRTENLYRLYGQDYAVTCKMVDRTGYDEAELHALLSPFGLWEKVLGFNQSLVKNLLTDETVPADVRDTLKELKKVLSTYPRFTVKELETKEEEETEK